MLNRQDGEKLVRLARKTVEKYFENGKLVLEECKQKNFLEKRGVFVTIETHPEKNLRGCIGFPDAILPLWDAVQQAAVSAAFEDPRFAKLDAEELEKIVFEISVLTKPEPITVKDASEYCKKIKIGEDGLIIQCDYQAGLLLPQVATEQQWDTEEFLDNLCFKAGLLPDALHDKKTKIWKFQAQIFCEEKPNGKIIIRT
jgi:hypothetical protein